MTYLRDISSTKCLHVFHALFEFCRWSIEKKSSSHVGVTGIFWTLMIVNIMQNAMTKVKLRNNQDLGI
jgi:hypothetical protein